MFGLNFILTRIERTFVSSIRVVGSCYDFQIKLPGYLFYHIQSIVILIHIVKFPAIKYQNEPKWQFWLVFVLHLRILIKMNIQIIYFVN